jgi:hypothetical protein
MSIDDVTDLTPRVRYTASAAQTDFDYDFPIFQDADLIVVVDDVTLALTTDYTVSGEGDDLGGTVSFVVPMTGGEIVVIYRDIVIERISDFQPNGPNASVTMNDELDKLYLIAQELKAKVGRAIRFPFTAAQTSEGAELTPISNWYSKFLYIGSTGLLEAASAVTGVVTLTQNIIGSLLNPQTPAEVLAGVDPPNKWYPAGKLYRYGTNSTPGTTDMTTAVQNWASVGGSLQADTSDVVLVSDVIPLVSKSTLDLGTATFKTTGTTKSIFRAVSKTDVVIRDGKLLQTAAGTVGHVAQVEFNACTFCKVEDTEHVGAQHRAILLSDSSYCIVDSPYIHDSFGYTLAGVDSCDIAVYRNSDFNIVRGARCYGGLLVEHGVMVQGLGTSLAPHKNVVDDNRVGPHNSYGLLDYQANNHVNTWNEFTNNEVEGITGTGVSGDAGMGIYIQGSGGDLVANNIVRNCCLGTTLFSLKPAGITLNLDAAFMPVDVIDNTVIDTYNASACIAVTTGPANIRGNTVIQSAGMLTAIGILNNNANDVSINDNDVTFDTSIALGHGIYSNAGSNLTNVSICINRVKGCSAYGIRIDQVGGFTTTDLVLNGNEVSGGGAASIPLGMYSVTEASVTGNVLKATTVVALDMSTCLQTRFANNILKTSGTVCLTTAGTCTDSVFDKSNYYSGNITNSATALIVERWASAEPAAGTAAVGDTWWKTNPAAAGIPGGRCTTAGSPGTWKNMAALAA